MSVGQPRPLDQEFPFFLGIENKNQSEDDTKADAVRQKTEVAAKKTLHEISTSPPSSGKGCSAILLSPPFVASSTPSDGAGPEHVSPTAARSVDDKRPVHHKWPAFLREDLENWEFSQLVQHIRERRQEILTIKQDYKIKQALAETGSSDGTAYESFRGFPDMRIHVKHLMAAGKLLPVEGGKSGVYFLCTSDGRPLYVIKPLDEDFMALNNPKYHASPYADNEVGRPKAGVPFYHSVQNAELAYLFAKHMGIERATPKIDVMILASPQFSDVTDGVTVDLERLLQEGGEPDREKLCLVQEFVPACRELGEILLSTSGLSMQEYSLLEDEVSREFQTKAIPIDLDREMFEDYCLLCWVTGEKDGNAGNCLIADKSNPETGKRSIIKIDNAASIPEDNNLLRSGISWFDSTYGKQILSPRALKIIDEMNPKVFEELMKSRGKSDEAVAAMKARVELMKEFIPHAINWGWEIIDIDDFMYEKLGKTDSESS